MTQIAFQREINPIKFANRGEQITGQMALQEMQRLSVLLADASGFADVSLQFGKDIEGIDYITGIITVTLTLICQRCWHPFQYPMTIQLGLSPVKDDSAAAVLPTRYEPILCQGGVVLAGNLVEDEILLNMPLIVKHSDNQCTERVISD